MCAWQDTVRMPSQILCIKGKIVSPYMGSCWCHSEALLACVEAVLTLPSELQDTQQHAEDRWVLISGSEYHQRPGHIGPKREGGEGPEEHSEELDSMAEAYVVQMWHPLTYAGRTGCHICTL